MAKDLMDTETSRAGTLETFVILSARPLEGLKARNGK
jgi:hypothetical protein